MPWEHCGAALDDDAGCPACGKTKAQWTMEWNVTRTFRVKQGKAGPTELRVSLVDAESMPVAGEVVVFRLPGPDGAQVEAKLNDYGLAKVPSPPGESTVRFPGRAPEDFAGDVVVAAREGGAEAPVSTTAKRELRLGPIRAVRFEREVSNRDRTTVLLAELQGVPDGAQVTFQPFTRAPDGTRQDVGAPIVVAAREQRASAPWEPEEEACAQPVAPEGTALGDATLPPDVKLDVCRERSKATSSHRHVAGEVYLLRAEVGGQRRESTQPLRWTLDVDLRDDLGQPLPDHEVDVIDLHQGPSPARRRVKSDAKGRLQVTGLGAPVAVVSRHVDVHPAHFDDEPVLTRASRDTDLLSFLLGEDGHAR